jgi:hypothetical protein
MSSVPFKYEDYFDKHVRRIRGDNAHFSALSNSLKGTIEASKWRSILPYVNGNIGIGYIITSTESITLAVESQDKRYLPNPHLKGLLHKGFPRDACTEFRILNGLILGGDVQYNDNIHIFIYTENAPCDSCANVIEEFLNTYPKSHIKVVYKLHSKGAEFCSWPSPIENWKPNSRNRFVHKHVKNKKGKKIFEIGRWYVLVSDISGAWIGRYKFNGYSDDVTISKWSNVSGFDYTDIDFIPDCSLFKTTRKDDTVRDPLGSPYIEQFF